MRDGVPVLTDHLYRKASAGYIPLSGTFELTPLCNFACRMCYVRKTAQEVQSASRSPMTLEDWISLAETAAKQGMLFVLLTGGEPTLWPDFWVLYEHLVSMGMLVAINTNGSTIDEAAVERLRQHPPRRMNITLYGASDATYERLCGVKNMFGRIDRAISLLQAAGIQVKLNCSLTPYNVCDLEEMVRYAADRNLVLEIASYMFPPVRRNESMVGTNDRFTPQESAAYRLKAFRLQYGEERYAGLLRSILQGNAEPAGLDESCIDPLDGRIRCRAGKACFWTTWDGYVMPCGIMDRPKLDLRQQSFPELWARLNEISSNLVLTGICEKCSHNQLCHPCAAMAVTETGSFAGVPKYLCDTVAEMKRIAERELSGTWKGLQSK